MLVGGAVLPAEGGLHVRRCEGVDGRFVVTHIDAELIAKAGSIAVGGPDEDDAVGLTLHLDVVHRYRAYRAYRHRGFRVVALSILIPELRHIVDIVCWRRFVSKTAIGIGKHIVVEFGNLRTVAINHPMIVAIVAWNRSYAPVQAYLLLGLVEHARKVLGLHGGRVDGDGSAQRSAVVGKGATVKIVVNLIGADCLSLRYVSRPRTVVHPEFYRAPVLINCGFPHQVLNDAVEDEA